MDPLSSQSTFGDLAIGTSYFSEPRSQGVLTDLTTGEAAGIAAINDLTFESRGSGCNFLEEGLNAVKEAALGASQCTGSFRFIIALGDANFKESDGSALASTLASFTSFGPTFIGMNFECMETGNLATGTTNIKPIVFDNATDASIIVSSTDSDEVVDAITAGMTSAFDEYSLVLV